MSFVRCDEADRAFRFPPSIGALNTAPLLFVGINPRISQSNRSLHESLMRDYSAFRELAGNRKNTNQPYIAPGGEVHYSRHLRIANELFPNLPFEAVAVATELFFCASSSASGLPISKSPCAERYLDRVLAWVRPTVVFAVGRQVQRYITARCALDAENAYICWGKSGRAVVVPIPHPNARGEKVSKWNAATEIARVLCRGMPGKYSLTRRYS